MTTTEEARRDFWRCTYCLSILATEGEMLYMRNLHCACGHPCLWMGQVVHDRLVHKNKECACDHRCTGARGPKCSCRCGGKNHGTGRVVSVIRDQGGIPRITADVSAAIEKAQEFDKAAEGFRAELKSRYPEYEERKSGAWLSAFKFGRYRDCCDFMSGIHKARCLKSHGGRMKALVKLKAYADKVWAALTA